MASDTPDGASAATSESRPADEDALAPVPGERTEHLTYEGTRVPKYLVLVWLAFFVWGIVYLLKFVPGSVREWFLGK